MSEFHEKQQLWQCGVHALNNLFQERWTSREMLDDIAVGLHRRDQQQQLAGLLNPYKSVVPYLGYYDVGVLVAALETRGACLTEHFVIASAMTVERLREATADCIGLIVNIETTAAWLLKGKHWYSILKLGESFCNMDSKLETPVSVGDVSELHRFLVQEMESRRAHVFIVGHKVDSASSPAQDESKS